MLQLSDCLAEVLSGSIQMNAAGDLTRTSGTKRPYHMVSRKSKEPEPPKVKKPLLSIESLSNGTAFGPSKVSAQPQNQEDVSNKYSCCKKKCNEQWDSEVLERTRSSLVRYGTGTQPARKIFVRECFAPGSRQLYIRDGLSTLPVCWAYFRALMGVSFRLLQAAGSVGPVHM